MNQTKLESLLESFFNVLIGYAIAVVSQIIILPLYGVELALSQNFIIGAWFTIISIVRSYTLRRWFNAGLHKSAARITKRYFKKV